MLLWTIQTLPAWGRLEKRGELIGSRRLVDRRSVSAYDWMAHQMAGRIGKPPFRGALPVWGWYQCHSQRRKRPDLRTGGYLPKGVVGVRIEFEIEDNEVLLSDFELWHFALNYWYLPASQREGRAFDAAIARAGFCYYRQKPVPNSRWHQRIEESWTRIFDLSLRCPSLTRPRRDKSIQATVWRVTLDQIRAVKRFEAR